MSKDKEVRRNFYIEKIEAEAEMHLNTRQKEIIYRSFVLGLTEKDIDCFIFEKSVIKQEYMISCFLDNLPHDLVKGRIAATNNLQEMKCIKRNFLSKGNWIPKPLLLPDTVQLNQIKMEKEQLEHELKILTSFSEENQKKICDLMEEINKRKEEIESLNLMYTQKRLKESEYMMKKTISYKKPTKFLDKLAYVFGRKELEEEKITEVEAPHGEDAGMSACDILCNPNYTIDQLCELQQGLLDGLHVNDIRSIANPDLSAEKMQSMRKFLCKINQLHFTKGSREISQEKHVEKNHDVTTNEDDAETGVCESLEVDGQNDQPETPEPFEVKL